MSYTETGYRLPDIGIFLEQLGLEYEVKFKSMNDDPKKGVKGEDYLKVCPNGRTPALVDHKNNDFVVWESGAILKYLANKYDDSKQYAGKTVEEQATIDEWLFFQCTGHSPVQGNLFFSLKYWPSKYNEEAPKNVINRFRDENYRVLNVFEERLKKQAELLGKDKAWLAFDHPTIADISTIPWFILLTKFGEVLEVKLEDYPNVAEYIKRSQALPSVQKIYSQFSY
ncbi:glutathione transferase [Malassezia yamatoensis]|uniref:Glutathione transferase n=1 Tax=Malassezia yamatoensis TaxID=253288 RepID=A0AAJ6CGH1_9BASI|nr:glutathione transferase [Malassezia yamatoensis]